MRIQIEMSDGITDYIPSYISKLDTILIYFFCVGILMYKQIPLVITASILLTAFLTVALYTGSEVHAQAGGGNMTSSNATAASGGNMTQPLVPPKPHP